MFLARRAAYISKNYSGKVKQFLKQTNVIGDLRLPGVFITFV